MKSNLTFGSIGGNISDVLVNLPQFSGNLGILITCLDSDINVSQMKNVADTLSRTMSIESVGRALWIPTFTAEELLCAKVFVHFDELYLCARKPTANSLPVQQFTSDSWDFSEELPPAFEGTVGKLGAERYLSDGTLLNFMCDDKTLVERLHILEDQ